MTAHRVWTLSRGHVAIGLLALAVFLPGARWGVPHATAPNRAHAWGVDDETPLGALSEVRNIVEPSEFRNLGYPLLYPFLTTGASLPYLGYLKVTGGLATPQATWPFGLADPTTAVANLGLIAHLVTVLLAVGLVIAAFDAGRTAGGVRVAALFAVLAMLAYPMVYYGRTGNVDVPMLFFIGLAFAAFARWVVHGVTKRRAVALGAAIGLALATKEAALGAFLGMPFVLLPLQAQAHERGLRSLAAWKPLLIVLGVSLLALGAGSGLFVDPGRYIAHIQFLTGRLDTLASAAPTHETFPYTLGASIAFSRAIIADLATTMTWPGLALAGVGAAIAVARRDRRALLLVPAVTYIVWMFLVLRVAQLRYMLPGAFLLALFSATLLDELWTGRGAKRVLALSCLTFVLGVLGLRAIDLSYQMMADSRYEAARWFEERAGPGDLIEYFGPDQKLPPLQEGVVTRTAAPYRGMYVAGDWSDSAIRRILDGWDERRPEYVIAIPDHTSLDDAQHSASLPPALFRSLLNGRESYRLVATFQTASLFPWLGTPALDYPAVNPRILVFQRTAP